jgi:hypothetical protein
LPECRGAALRKAVPITSNPSEDAEDGDFMKNLNPESLTVCGNAKLEKYFENAKAGDTYQFLRTG